MIDNISVLYYDGNRSLPKKARIEISIQKIYLFEGEGYYIDNGIVFEIENCNHSYLNGKLFVYLDKTASSYFVIEPTNILYEDLSNLLSESTPKGIFEKLLKQKWYSLLGVLVVLGGIFYFFLSVVLPSALVSVINTRQETAFGERVYQTIIAESKIDSQATILAQSFADHLKLSDKYTIQVTVIKEAEINAFALPGGHIVIHSGILKIMDHSEELVALLGHESTHINKRHSLQAMISRMGLSLFQTISFSGLGGGGDVILKNATSLRQLSFSRNLEREADSDGINLIQENKMDPNGMKELMRHLQQAHKSYLLIPSFLSTHPLTEERIQNANDYMKRNKNYKIAKNVELENIWVAFKNIK
jgi:Zn-dependent protease with chaperone function